MLVSACLPASTEADPAQNDNGNAVQPATSTHTTSTPTQSVASIVDSLNKPLPDAGRPKLPTADNPLPKPDRPVTPRATPTISELANLLPTVTPTRARMAVLDSIIAAVRDSVQRGNARTNGGSDTTSESIADLPSIPRGQVNADVVNVRSGPGTVYNVIARIRDGDTTNLVGRNETGSWLRICCPAGSDQESWISAEFIDVTPSETGVIASLPIAAIPPTPVPQVQPSTGAGGQTAAALAAAPAAGLPGPGNFSAPSSVNPLTGLPLAGGLSTMRPIIVCINNDYAARPQFGTSQADVIYEYLMEGYGITRFSAIYYGTQSTQIGPVRSARLINYYMGALYEAGLVCSGASDQVRYQLKHQAPFPYMDIDLDDPSNTRYSVSIGTDYRTRLRTASTKLRSWLSTWGVEQPAAIRGFTFGNSPDGGAPAITISIPYPSGTGSQVSYRYDAGSGRYLRHLGGGPHVDGNTGVQLALENVIVQYVPHEATDIVEDSLGSTSIRLNLFGSGQAIVFRDGAAFVGVWRSTSRGDTPRFYLNNGTEIPLKAGRTWISIVPLSYTIGYQ